MDQQRADLASLRDRAGSLLGFGGLAAAFLGGLAIRDAAPVSHWTWVGAVCFSLLALATLFVLWPRTFTLSLDAPELVGWIEDARADLNSMRRDAALWLDLHYEANRNGALKWMYRAYTLGMALLLVEIVALLIDMKGR